MILDEKIIMFPPPPPYLSSSSHPMHPRQTLTSLPAHILLQIIHHTFPQDPPPPSYLISSSNRQQQQLQLALYQDTKPEKQRKTLYWLGTSLRLVSRQLYTACMHVLRSTYLPAYQSFIRAPYSSDPFPLSVLTSSNSSSGGVAPSSASAISANGPPAYDSPSTPTSSSSPMNPAIQISPLLSMHRETPVLDRFIALKVRQDILADESSLHTDREDAFKDLFDVAQPRARLEDLVRVYGVREGVVSLPVYFGREGRMYTAEPQSWAVLCLPPGPSTPVASSSRAPAPPPVLKTRWSLFSLKKPSPPSTVVPHRPQPKTIQPIPFPSLSVSFSPRRVGLVLSRSRTIAEVPRLGVGRNREPLEVLARELVRELKVALGG